MTLQRLGPFELIRVLGRGGMGTVYEARHDGHSECVAVKALAPIYSLDEKFRARFEGEIEALLRLEHENIVRLLSYGQDDGNLYFAMELVKGNSLYEEQKKGHVFHWREIISIGRQVCAGLRHAHDRGIIHRDLKPGNLMVDSRRQIKITDFGIAKSFGSISVTSEGNVVGTMDFMSPEQARGERVTTRSDIFSLGAVLYALLAGRPPFLRDSVEKTLESLLSTRPPDRLDRIASDTPAPLAALIHRLLEKDPARRIATALAVGRQLELVEEYIPAALDADTQVVGSLDEEAIIAGETFQGAVESSGTPVTAIPPQPVNSESAGDETAVPDVHVGMPLRPRSPDYFNQVTPQQRKKSIYSEAATGVRGVMPILAALITVLGLIAFGIWYSLIKAPDADQLLSTIRASAATPQRVLREMELFLYHWPEHEQVEYIKGLMEFAEAVQFRQTLPARARLSSQPMSAIQEQFLDITENYRKAPQAAARMRRFLAAYNDTSRLSDEDARTVNFARIYNEQILQLAEIQIRLGEENVADLFMQAQRTANDEEAIDIYLFIIDQYGQDDWAQDHVERAQQEIDRLNEKTTQSAVGEGWDRRRDSRGRARTPRTIKLNRSSDDRI